MKSRNVFITLAGVLFIAFFAGSAFAGDTFKLVYYDGHIHTYRSDGNGSVVNIKEMALRRGLNAVVVTDHCRMLTREEWASLVSECSAASDETFLALPGFEVTGSDGIFNRTHINALGVSDPFAGNDSDCLCPEEVWPSPPNPAGTGALYPENLTEWVGYIHSQGGIAVHNHPSGTTKLMYGVNAMEVYNQGHVDDVAGYAKMLGYSDSQAWQFGMTLNNFALYGERDVNTLVPFPGYGMIPLRYALYYATQYFEPYVGQWLGAPQAPLSSWDQLLMAYVNGTARDPIFGLANSDAHNTNDLDCTDGSCSKVGMGKNGAYVKELTAGELYKAIKAGRTFATTGPSLNLDVNSELMGDTAYILDGAAEINLSVDSETPGFIVARIDIIKNGVVWKTITPYLPACDFSFEDVVAGDGYYRVEVTTYSSRGYQFAWSNPVFVRVE